MKKKEKREYEINSNVCEMITMRLFFARHVIKIEKNVKKIKNEIEEYFFITDLQF
jgi:hypothetical protein